jgi:hypothetical protein
MASAKMGESQLPRLAIIFAQVRNSTASAAAGAARLTGHSERNEADEILLTERPRDRRVEAPPANSAKSPRFADRTGWQSPPPAAAVMLFCAG